MSAIIKTHLNLRQSPKFNVSEQVPYVGIEVLLMACRMEPFGCVNVVSHWLSQLYQSGILVLRHGLLYEIDDLVYGQQHSSPLAATSIISLLGAWRYAAMENLIEIRFSCCFPAAQWLVCPKVASLTWPLRSEFSLWQHLSNYSVRNIQTASN